MALTFALRYDGHTYIWWERFTRYGTSRMSPILQLGELCIMIKDPLYYLILTDEKEKITIKSVHSVKMARMLYENIQDIIKNSKIYSGDTENIELNIIVCTRDHIFELGNPWHIREVEYAVLSSSSWSSESAMTYYLASGEIAARHNQKFAPQKTLKNILSRYSETWWKTKIVKL